MSGFAWEAGYAFAWPRETKAGSSAKHTDMS
jgi:hypothetical protein